MPPPVPNLPSHDGGRYPYGLTGQRFVRAYFVVPLILLPVLFLSLPNWALFLAYLLASLALVFEIPLRRVDIIGRGNATKHPEAWIEQLQHMPPHVQQYWRDVFLTVENIAHTHHPAYWRGLTDHTRWMVVNAIEMQTSMLLDYFTDPAQHSLPDPRNPKT